MDQRKIYLDNAASTPMDPEVLEFMLPYFLESYGNPSSVHHHGRTLRAAVEKARKDIAAAIGASPAEIFFTSGGTEADNMAINGAVKGLGVTHIVSTLIEHHAVGHPIEELEKTGKVRVTWLPVDEKGNPDLVALEAALDTEEKTLVTLMHANNEIGTLLDMKRVGEICARHGAYFHSDTVQAMGNVRYNLNELNVHFVTASGHKFYGPKGVGFLYMKAGTGLPPFITGGGQERNMRAGTENVSGIVGLAFALCKCYGALEEKNSKLLKLKHHMMARMRATVPGVQFNGETDPDKSIPTVLNVALPGDSTESMLLFNLDINGISASGGSACTSGSVKGSHVLSGIGCSPERAANSVRFSFGIQNTIDEIDFVVDKVAECLGLTAGQNA